jgi:hypothetical protein
MNALIRSERSCLFVLLCCYAIWIAACAAPTTTPAERDHLRLSREAATPEAFSRVESKLATVRPGDTLESLNSRKILPKGYAVTSLGMVTGAFAVGDGWIDSASGGDQGGLWGTGTLISVSQETAIGSHLFGYLEKNTYVIPKVELQIIGDIVSKQEFDTLHAAQKNWVNIGFWSASGGDRIYAKNLRVHAVKQLDFPQGPDLSKFESKTTSVTQHFTSKLTPAEFEKSKPILEKIPPDTDIYGAIRALDGWYVCIRAEGSSCPLWMSGFLNFEDKYRFSVVKTGDALYNVWAFGYLDAEQHEVPKLAVILRNGKVKKLVPYTDRASLETQMRP